MTSRRPARLVAAVAFVTLLVLAAPAAVLGHAELDEVSPADKSTVAGAPAEIVMTFTQDLDPARSNIRLVNAANTVVADASTVDAPRTMRLPVPTDLPPGVYTARWVSFSSEDNEQDRGTTTFTITAATPPPTVAPTAPPSVAPSVSPTLAPSVPPSVAPSPSAPPTSPTTSTTDALLPIVVVVPAVLGLGLWLLRGRARRAA